VNGTERNGSTGEVSDVDVTAAGVSSAIVEVTVSVDVLDALGA
jgi:hypothetical protein